MNMRSHFVIATYGSSGDVFPFIEIGRYLVSRKYKVSFITTPWFENVVKTGGMKYVPFGTMKQAVDLLNDSAIWHPIKGLNVIWAKGVQPNIHTVRLCVESMESREDIVILCNSLMMPLADLARTHRKDLRVALFYQQPTAIRTHYGRLTLGAITLPRLPRFLTQLLYSAIDALFFDKGIVPVLNNERSKLGLAPIAHFRPYVCSSADAYITLFPEWYAPPKPDYPKPLVSGDFVFYRSSKDSLSDELAKFLDAGPPPILFTVGTPTQHVKKFFQIAVDVIKRLNARAVVLTGFRDQLPADLPASVLWQTYVPFNEFLPRASIVVHHGGMGTFAEAGRAGIPQLIVPFSHDHFENARIITDLGIGESIGLHSLTSNKLFKKLSHLQRSETIKARCVNVACNFRSSLTINQIADMTLAAIGLPSDNVAALAESDRESVLELLSTLASKGLKFSVEGNDLNCYAPKGMLTEKLRESITQNKSQLIDMLRT